MAKIIGSPSRYVQQRDSLSHLADFAKNLSTDLLVLITERGYKRVGKLIEDSAKEVEGANITFCFFNGECSQKEIKRVQEEAKKVGATSIIGVGGGKALDTAKAAAHYSKLPTIICPTIASSDAPCSALSVIYSDEGVFESYLFLPSNPNMVIMDTAVIAKAPVRLLVSGLGDALATYFEARACKASNAQNCVGGTCSLAALSLARLCYDTILENGYKAMIAVKGGNCTPAVEDVIEANTYLSGVGFESAGLAAAHAIHNGLTCIEETHQMYHGEKVAFGTLTQLILENADREELEEVIEFCLELGLPVTLEELGIKEIKEEEIRKVAEIACADGDTLHNMPFPVDSQIVYDAIMAADAMGHYYRDIDED